MNDKLENNYQKVSDDIKDLVRIQILSNPKIKPVLDGIINAGKYTNAKYRILWILKESNDVRNGVGGGWDLCDVVNKMSWTDQKKKTAGRTVFKTLSLCSDFILNSESRNELNLDMNEGKWNYFKSTAYINIKKIPGTSKVSSSVIQKAYNNNSEILHQQIKDFNPHIIIGCNTLGYFSNYLGVKRENKIFFSGEAKKENKGYYATSDHLYIDTWHPNKRDLSFKQFLINIKESVIDWEANYLEIPN